MTTREQRHCRRKVVAFKQDDDSYTDQPNQEPKRSDGREPQIIHSGHFMVSSLHIEHTPKKGYDFDTVNKQTCQTYRFGKASTSRLSIDASLTKLFECMTLAYSGKLVSPKWKNFKGLKLLWRDKIRLNNAIWRAWYMQYVEKRQNPICHFVTPLDGSIDTEDQRRSEAIFTEGKYWKRGIEIVREYHKWRTHFKKRSQKHKDDDLSSLLKGADEQLSLFGEICPDTFQNEMGVWRASNKRPESPVPMEMDSLLDMEMLMYEFSDTLFSTLPYHQPMAWPNPREIAHTGNADMIQPGLINLQPSLDFMDTFDPLQDLFHNLRPPALPSASSIPPVPSSSSKPQASILPTAIASAKIPSIGVASQSGEMHAVPAYAENCTSLFSGPLASIPGSVTTVPVAPPPPTAVPNLLPVQPSMATSKPPVGNPLLPSVAARLSSPKVRPNAAAPRVAQHPTFTLPRMPNKPAAPPQPPTAALASHPAFTQPKPSEPAGTSKRRHVQNIIPAKPRPPPPLFLAGPFPAQGSAVIIAPSPLQAEAAPPSNIVIAPADITQGCRPSHISAEQKRRFSINVGFRTLCGLVPTLKTKSCSKPTVEYISKLQQERQQIQEEVRCLREEIEELNASISSCHQKLPATGVPVTQPRFDYMWDNFNDYVRNRTLQNWKFWIFSIIIKPLFESFNSAVSTASVEELRQTTLRWLDHHCALPALRPMVLDTFRQLSTTTSILTDPTLLPEEARRAVAEIHKHTGES
ncbi:hypothetical protein AAFF_G00047210 [Aldrovandia affinis]|uniref:BHLH domain-containing protein n=1 Tax=Aldrovandia affinis TaxID=143900 RepID=A0AAD7S1N1_9TELE|nr:hypothetical protein AAFF_G00047210 [Aldrovandia affinis]